MGIWPSPDAHTFTDGNERGVETPNHVSGRGMDYAADPY